MIKLYIQKTDLFSPLNFCSGKQEDGYHKSEDTCRDDSVLRKVLTQISGAFFRLQDPPVSPEAAPSASEDADAPVPRRLCRSPSCASRAHRKHARLSPLSRRLPPAQSASFPQPPPDSLHVICPLSGRSSLARKIVPPPAPPPFPPGDIGNIRRHLGFLRLHWLGNAASIQY